MNAATTFVVGIAAVVALLAAVWWRQRTTRNANAVDPTWSWSLGGLGLLFAACGTAPPGLRLLLAAGSAGWALRLGTHLYLRNRGQREDARYARFRDRWGAKANGRMFWLIESQAVFSALLSSAFALVAWRDGWPPAWASIAAVVVWVVSVAGEAVADAQLRRFRRDPANRQAVNRIGLWRYSRHPNYFFESLHWFTYVFLAIGSPWGWGTLVAPIVMAVLLLKVSGVPMTEAHLAKTRPGYAEYIRTTSAFIPWPPKTDR